MFVVDLNNYSIRMHAGDSGSVSYNVDYENPTENDKIIWTMRNTRGEIVKQNVMTVADGVATVAFLPEDTEKLDAGNYRYDIRVLVNATGFAQQLTESGGYDGYAYETVDDICTPMEAVTVQIIGPVGKIEHSNFE